MKNINPFVIGRYLNSEYFCNRKHETQRIVNAIENQRNLTLISHRRLGKTGLILHAFEHLRQKNDLTLFYLDMMHTNDLSAFVRSLAKAIIGKFDKRTTQVLKSFGNLVRSLRPSITIDPVTGSPGIEIFLQDNTNPKTGLDEIFKYLQYKKRRIVIALDEFQQIAYYPEKNVEALLRGHIQQLNNTNFIFSGSQKHMLTSIFGDYSRPFYQSTEFLELGKINREVYQAFITQKFEQGKFRIDPMAVEFILELTNDYTYYVQFLCNKLYGQSVKNITNEVIAETLSAILKEQEVVYYNYRNFLTEQQFNLLTAIAKEKKVNMPTSKAFIQKYKLGASSSINTALKALVNKEMIFKEKGYYQVYDVFFSKWLEQW
jgi:AAA+ ATPase superfamily predicted ATPase